MRHFGFPRVNWISPAFCQQSLPRDKGVYLPFTAASCPYLMGGGDGGDLPKWFLSHWRKRGERGGKLLFDPKVGELASLIRPVLEYNVAHVQGIKT